MQNESSQKKSNGVTRLKSDLRVLKENVNCMQDVVDNLQYDVTPHIRDFNGHPGSCGALKR